LANRHIRFIETEDGGHCSFLAEPGEDDGHWAEQQIMRFVSGLEREGPFSTKGTTAHEGDAPASGY
jgi:hypothetical protein